MSCVFSTRFVTPIPCAEPQLTVNFPVAPAPANTVVLANGAVVDLNELGRIIAANCPVFVCQPNVIMSTQSVQSVQTVPFGTGQTVELQ